MIVVNKNETVKLWMLYEENGIPVSGKTTLKVVGKVGESIVLSEQSLTEIGSTGEYYYDWSTNSIDLDAIVKIYFMDGSVILDIEEYRITLTEDQDGLIL